MAGVRAFLIVVSLVAACRVGFDPLGAPPGEVAVPPGDAGSCEPAACAAAGGTCAGAVCELIASSENPVSCPAGMPCRLVCNGYRFCRDGAACGDATWCEIDCIGYRACENRT